MEYKRNDPGITRHRVKEQLKGELRSAGVLTDDENPPEQYINAIYSKAFLDAHEGVACKEEIAALLENLIKYEHFTHDILLEQSVGNEVTPAISAISFVHCKHCYWRQKFTFQFPICNLFSS